jgi:hypothetical protein
MVDLLLTSHPELRHQKSTIKISNPEQIYNRNFIAINLIKEKTSLSNIKEAFAFYWIPDARYRHLVSDIRYPVSGIILPLCKHLCLYKNIVPRQ